MPHLGKFYPQLNRSRMILSTPVINAMMATEYWFQVTSWVGPIGIGMPLSGRGLLPNAWVQGETSITIQGTVESTFGEVINLGFTTLLEPYPAGNNVVPFISYGGADQVSGGAVFVDGYPWNTWSFDYFRGINVLPGAVIYPFSSLIFTAVLWNDPTGPPPLTSPF